MQNNRILFVTIPEKGHINPMIGVAQHLQESGYELAIFAQKDISNQLKKAKLDLHCYSAPSKVNIDPDFITQGKQFVEQLSDKIWLRNWIKTLLIDAIPFQVELIHQAVRDFQPALIVTDPMIYASAIVAQQSNLPWVGVSSSLNPITPAEWKCELTDTLDMLHTERVSLFERNGLAPRFKVSDAISPWLNIVFSTETYMPREICKNEFSFYVGHSFPLHPRGDEADFPFDRLLPDKKKVYMSMGSQIYYHPHLFSTVAKALCDDNIQLIFSINELFHTPFINTLPKNVIAVPYAPQLQLLKHVDLMITHGGANSVMESLAIGVPIAMLPICNDQFLQAQFVSNASVGIILNPKQPDPTVYRQQILPLLEKTAPQRINSAKIARSFHQRGGAKEACQLITKLLANRAPLMPTS